MKNQQERLHNSVSSNKVSQHSVQAAVEYLIEECLRLGDIDGGTILQNALTELQKQSDAQMLDRQAQDVFLSFLRQFLKLDSQEKLYLIKLINELDGGFLRTMQ